MWRARGSRGRFRCGAAPGCESGRPNRPTRHRKYFNAAQTLAEEQSLDFLELVGPDTAIISSAEWPARFGYKEDWLAQPVDWKTQGVFLKGRSRGWFGTRAHHRSRRQGRG